MEPRSQARRTLIETVGRGYRGPKGPVEEDEWKPPPPDEEVEKEWKPSPPDEEYHSVK